MKIDKNLNLNTVFSLDGSSVANFNASIILGDEIDYQTNKSVYDQKVYRENREEVNNAFNEFEDEVYKIVDKIESGVYETV